MTVKFEASRYQTGSHAEQVTIWRGATTVYTPVPGDANGGSYYTGVTCKHAHTTPAQADECAERLARYIERHSACPDWAADEGQIASLIGHVEFTHMPEPDAD